MKFQQLMNTAGGNREELGSTPVFGGNWIQIFFTSRYVHSSSVVHAVSLVLCS